MAKSDVDFAQYVLENAHISIVFLGHLSFLTACAAILDFKMSSLGFVTRLQYRSRRSVSPISVGSWVDLTDLKYMADCQEWKGQIFKKICVRKTTQHEEKFFQPSLKGMIRFDLNMEHDEVHGKFFLTVCICSICTFAKNPIDLSPYN